MHSVRLSLFLVAASLVGVATLASACSRTGLDAELSSGLSTGGVLATDDTPDADTAADGEPSDGATTSPTCTAPTAPIETSQGPSTCTPFPLGTCIGDGIGDDAPYVCCPADQFPLRCMPAPLLDDGGPGQPVPPPFDLTQCTGCIANLYGVNLSSPCCCPCAVAAAVGP
jgi:hypothetical protein